MMIMFIATGLIGPKLWTFKILGFEFRALVTLALTLGSIPPFTFFFK